VGGGLSARDVGGSAKKTRAVAAMHYRNPAVSFKSRLEAGAGNWRVGNGEQQIEVARSGADTHQDARAASASRSSAELAGASITIGRTVNRRQGGPRANEEPAPIQGQARLGLSSLADLRAG
jgi:hypothetical protein